MFPEFIITITILLFSVVIHEVSHGAVANKLGDPTARLMGRLTLNPLKHIDPIGSILVPLIMVMLPGNFIFGWAKPVPYNPHNLKNKRWGEAMVGFAGPGVNLFLALLFGLTLRFATLPPGADSVFVTITLINLLLAIFNLVPIPPLDGSKLLFALMPNISPKIRQILEKNGFMLLLLFIFFGFQLIIPIIYGLFSLITGISLGALF